MNGAFYIGATGLEAQQRALDLVANNIANLNTAGFKRSEVRFAELVGANVEPSGHPSTVVGVSVSSANRIFSQGDLKSTGRATDLAISGEGFIELMGPGGQAQLWRGGALKTNPDGLLAAANGMPLKAMITAPPNGSAATIDADGKVWSLVDGQSTQIGQIDLVAVKDLAHLKPVGEGLYRVDDPALLTEVSPGEESAGVLVQGAVEQSNVLLTDEMVTLLLLQRAYAANAQVVQAGDQLMAIANNLKR